MKLATKVIQEVRHRIVAGDFPKGSRIPSVRAMAQLIGVSKSTVVLAYEQMAADGVIESRPGSGFYVTVAPVPSLDLGDGADGSESTARLEHLRESLTEEAELRAVGSGWLPADWMPVELVARAIRNAVRKDGRLTLTAYGNRFGSEALRSFVSRRLVGEGASELGRAILTTSGATHSVDLVLRYFLRPGDTVLVDDPCYYNWLSHLKAFDAQVVAVPMTPQGPDEAILRRIVEQRRPRIYLTNAPLHNPTGINLTPASAHAVLKIVEEHTMLIVEDDVFRDFADERFISYGALGGPDHVLRIGSFSKSCSASLRVGYIAGKADWVAGLADLQMVTHMSPDPFNEQVVLNVVSQPAFSRHMKAVRDRLRLARETTTPVLQRLGCEVDSAAMGGMFVWVRLPGGQRFDELDRRARNRGLLLAHGSAFGCHNRWKRHIRLNLAWLDANATKRLIDAFSE